MSSTNRQPEVVGTTVVMTILVLLTMFCRFISRRMSGAGFWLDDWVVLVAGCVALAVNIITFILVADGEGKHEADLPSNAPKKVLYHTYITEIFIHFCVVTVKFSFLLLYGRVFARKAYRAILWVTGGLIAVWGASSVITLVFQCHPIRRAWEPDIPGTCVVLSRFLYGQSVPDVIFDVVLLLLPVAFVSRLQMESSQKIALSAVFLLGLITVVFSVLRLYFFARLKNYDFPWSRTDVDLWSVLEVNVGIVVSCIMTCGPLFKATLARAGITGTSDESSFVKPGLITIGSRGRARAGVKGKLTGYTDLESSVPQANGHDSRIGLTEPIDTAPPTDTNSLELDRIYVRRDIKVVERSHPGAANQATQDAFPASARATEPLGETSAPSVRDSPTRGRSV